MRNARLAIYLNDHLAGAADAIVLLERLAATDGEPGFRGRMRDLRAEIAEDRRVLETLLTRVGGTPTPKHVDGWLAEKLGRLKIGNGPGDTLARFESLEVLALGVIGKCGLWRALDALEAPELSSTDFAVLAERATRQFEQLEEARLGLAVAALGCTAEARAGGAMR